MSKNLGLKYLFKQYGFPMWKQIFFVIFLTLIGNVLATMHPLIMAAIMDVIVGREGLTLGFETSQSTIDHQSSNFFDLNTIGQKITGLLNNYSYFQNLSVLEIVIFLSMIFLLVIFIASILQYLATITSKWSNAMVTVMIRKNVMQHLLTLDIDFFNKNRGGDLISRILNDAKSTAQGIVPLIHSIIHQGTLIVIYGTFLFSTNIFMTFGAIFLVGVQYILIRILKNPVRRSWTNFYNKTANFLSNLTETFTSIRVIKSFGTERSEINRLNEVLTDERKAAFRTVMLDDAQDPINTILGSMAVIGILIMAMFQLSEGAMNLQGALMFVYVGKLLINPINKFTVNFFWIQALLAAFDRLSKLMQTKPTVPEGTINKNTLENSITVKNISFAYENLETNVIKNLSFTLKKGEVLALVGPSGGGKSTLTDLLLRFYLPQKGDIFIDDINLKEINGNNYRKIFGIVPQESLLFNDTIISNIKCGRDNITKEKVEEAAKIANAHEFILNLPNGYDTFVGDRGVRLSGGQRQRITIARAIVNNPEVLIFDEATSALDTKSEQQVQLAIDKVLKNSTAIVIAHRISTILKSDKIALVNKGEIENIGNHEELIKKSKMYKKLYELQYTDGNNINN